MFQEYVGMAILFYRKKKGMTQEELGRRIGATNKTVISRIEHGERISLDRLELIAYELDTKPSELMRIAEAYMEGDEGA